MNPFGEGAFKEKVLKNEPITHDFLRWNFGEELDGDQDDCSIVGNGAFLKLVNILKSDENFNGVVSQQWKGEYERTLRELTNDFADRSSNNQR